MPFDGRHFDAQKVIIEQNDAFSRRRIVTDHFVKEKSARQSFFNFRSGAHFDGKWGLNVAILYLGEKNLERLKTVTKNHRIAGALEV